MDVVNTIEVCILKIVKPSRSGTSYCNPSAQEAEAGQSQVPGEPVSKNKVIRIFKAERVAQ
jgi:hypothetical protein